eukprot:5960636-Lingulodinium_polyedra.AAC.1
MPCSAALVPELVFAAACGSDLCKKLDSSASRVCARLQTRADNIIQTARHAGPQWRAEAQRE